MAHCTRKKISFGSIEEQFDNYLHSSKDGKREMTTFYYKALLIGVIRSKNASTDSKIVRREMDFWSSLLSLETPDELL